MLLDSGSQDSVSFLSVFGLGGLGKTTLAQLVFNDERIKSEFPLRLWARVSDDNGEEFDVKAILARILESAFGDKHDGLPVDLVRRKLLGFLGGKKYLIVLDDVWNEDPEKWLALRKFLMGGGVGSRVLVTTRSQRTAMVVDEKYIYELKGLSAENSWRLFEMAAFGKTGREDVNSSELIEIGKKIVEQCSHVPLAIKVVGTLLYGQSLTKWRSFQACGVAKVEYGGNRIMSTLKLSYDNLGSPLKTCFTYCAMFPKDFRIKKKKLICLWMAQGYIVPFDVGQSLEDAGEEYFSILLQRCFFQDVEKNETGGVKSFKIHDLIHDVAQMVAGKGFAAVPSIQTNLGDETHHLFHVGSKCKGSIFSKCKARSYVRDGFQANFPVAKLVENWTFLRTLDLHDLDIETLPNSIGKLLHLRYLDLSRNHRLSALPDSVTNLYNLQTLNLDGCHSLKELPKDLAKLANLRHLYLYNCNRISAMPSGLDKLSGLCVLTQLELQSKGAMRGLEILRALKNLRGSIRINIGKNVEVAGASSEGYLRSKKHLVGLHIQYSGDENHGTLLEELEPPSSLTSLSLDWYMKATLPLSWYGPEKDNNWAVFLPNLVRVSFLGCYKLQNLPSMSKLLHLQTLSLDFMDELEYIEDFAHNGSYRPVFFPSLKTLKISRMKKLKGWWRGEDEDCDNCWQPFFSRLSVLEIMECPELRSFPACISLEKMTLQGVHKELRIMNSDKNNSIKLKEVRLDDLDYQNLLPLEGDRDGSLDPYIRYCYDRLKAHHVKTCFLYSALVLDSRQVHISVLVKSFITEGLLGGPTMIAYKRANDIVGLLVKASLLEASNETMMVRMHNMTRNSALAILSSSTEGRKMFLGRELGKLGAEQVNVHSFDRYLIKVGAQLKEPPPLEEWEQATVVFLMDNDFSTLPNKPYCPNLVSLFLQRNQFLRVIPASFFDSMHSLTNLDLSQTKIRSLPNSLLTLKNLQVLLLRDCEHLIELPSEIGQLTALQVLDLQGTELLDLPDTMIELTSLESLKVSFYGSINHSECNNLPKKFIVDGTISNLPLEELAIFVHPGDGRWTNSVSDITKEVTGLSLTILYFHFPELESLEYFLQGSTSWKNGNLTDFNFIVGHDFKHALSLVTRDAELMHRNSERCLRFVNGEAIPQGVMEVLKRATSLYLDHHVNISSLSDFGIYNMDALKVCILSDCPVVQAIIHLAEDGQVILPFVEYLSLNSLWNLEAIISGDHLFAEESFNMLTFLSLCACPKLTYVFTLSMMKNLPKLEELVIEDCVSLKYIISQEDLLGPDEFAVLPCLKVLKLYYLPNLSEIGRLSWANVEYMHFYNCPKLKNLCMTTDDTANIKEIAADKAWWDSLEWDEPLLSERLDKLFTQIQLDDL